MLARVANNLFWMGRYIERSEHIARYLNVNYFSSLDAPNELSQSRQFVFRSMLHMADLKNKKPDEFIEEPKILYEFTLDKENPFSIINNLTYVRENANSARDSISTEFYETINKFFHSVNNFTAEDFKKNGLYHFTTHITENSEILKSKLRNTLLHDEIFAIIMLGVHLERATQVIRIIISKYNDALLSTSQSAENLQSSYEWTTLLKCVQAYDMMRSLYKKTPTMADTLEFLILNPDCPRSITYCVSEINCYMKILNKEQALNKKSVAGLIGKIRADYEFKTIEDIEEDFQSFIKEILENLLTISERLEAEYFNY